MQSMYINLICRSSIPRNYVLMKAQIEVYISFRLWLSNYLLLISKFCQFVCKYCIALFAVGLLTRAVYVTTIPAWVKLDVVYIAYSWPIKTVKIDARCSGTKLDIISLYCLTFKFNFCCRIVHFIKVDVSFFVHFLLCTL